MIKSIIDGTENCECHSCIERFDKKGEPTGDTFYDNLSLSAKLMIICPECGNKRCPHASDHRLKCTNSNDPGQTGSVY